MFDELENIYPQKPEISVVSKKKSLQKNLMLFGLMLFVFVFVMQESLILVGSMILVIVFHELGHFIGMKMFKFKDNNIFYFPMLSSLVKQKEDYISQKQHLLTLIFGPLPGLIVGAVLLQYGLRINNVDIINMAFLFLGVNLFSLLPIDPVDGGRMMQTLFFPSNQQVKMYFVLVSSIVIIGVGYQIGFPVLMAFGFLMGFKVRSIQKNDSIYDELEEQDIDYKKTYKSLTDREYWKIRTVFLENNPKIREIIPSGDELWENERLITDQISNILRVKIKEDASPIFKIFIVAIVGASAYYSIDLILSNWDSFIIFLGYAGF